MAPEIRSYSCEMRTQQSDFSLVGYAARFNSPSSPIPGNRGMFVETILPGAFTRVLADPKTDVRCLFNHDANKVLGRTMSGTLTLSQDDKGLRFHCQLDKNNSDHTNLYSSVARGDISDCSFGFSTDDDSWDTDKNGDTRRTIRSFSGLFDVSVVCNPAYPNTTVSARSAAVQSFSAQLFRGKKSVHQVRVDVAARNGISVADLEDAELRLKAHQQAAVMATQNKTEDAALRAKAESLRQGGGFEVASDGGQAADPTQSLRCKANSVSSSPAEHRKAAMAHRAYRDRAKDSDTYAQHDTAAQDHDDAADGDSAAAIRCVENCRRTK